VLVLGITETVSWGILYYSLSVFIDPVSSEMGGSRAAIAGGLSVMLIVSGIAGIFVGRWLDDHGPRALMTAGSVLGVALVVAWSQVRDLTAFYAVWTLMGLAFAATNYSPAFATVTVWFRRLRSRALTVITLMAGLASTIFVPLAAWLVATQGWRPALLTLAGILAVVTVAPHALLLRRRPSDIGLGVDGDAVPSADGVTHHHEDMGASLREALRHPTFPWVAAAFALFALGVAVPVHFVAFLRDEGHSLAFAAAATGGIGAAQVVGRLVFAPLEGRLSPRMLSLLIYAGAPVAIAVLLLVPSDAGVVAFVILFGGARGMETLLRSTLVAGLYGTRRFASIASVLTLFTTVTQATAPFSLGAVYDAAGTYVPGLWALAGLLVLASGAIFVADRRPETA
jgi:sugar phosphate permease